MTSDLPGAGPLYQRHTSNGVHRIAAAGYLADMTTMPDDVDPFIGERIIAIRNRFGVDGLRQAAQMISFELAIFGGTQFSESDQSAEAVEATARGPVRDTGRDATGRDA